MNFVVDLTLPEGVDPIEVADWLLELLCNQDGEVPYVSCDGVEAER